MKPMRFTMAVAAGLILAAGPAAAFDVPGVTLLQSKPGSVRLMVRGTGSSGALLGFYVERIKKSEYDALGGWPASPQGSWASGSFTGTPSFNTQGTSADYALTPTEAIEVELGQLFDETGVAATSVDELEPNTQYVIRVRANGSGTYPASAFTPDIVVTTAPLAQNCTFTLGYWKNHELAWPVTSLTLGTVNYTAAELLQILNEPAQGRKLVILAHQLIAAKLNIANGANMSSISTTITSADLLIGPKVVPPIGSGTATNQPTTTYSNTLDDFNNGLIGPGHCDVVPAATKTWGSVKALYRN